MENVYATVRGGFRAAKGWKKSDQDKFLSMDEFRALLQAAARDHTVYGIRAYDLFALTGNFGLRCGEALDVDRDDFRPLAMGYFRVRTLKQKGTKEDRMYVDPAHRELALEILARRRGSNHLFPFSPRSARYFFAYYAKLAGLSPNVSFHALRHTAARMMLSALKGTDLAAEALNIVGAFLRHKPTTTGIYTTPTPEAMIRAMALKGAVR